MLNVEPEQFSQADGKTDVHEIHGRAVHSMKMKYGEAQTPQFTSTLKKKLLF